MLQPVIGRIAALVSQRPHFVCQSITACDNHPALARGDLLVRVKGKDGGIAKRTDWAPAMLCAKRFAGVLYDQQAVPACDGQKGIQIRG